MSEYDENDDIEPEGDDEGLRGLRKAKNAAEARQKELQEQLDQAAAERRELAAMKAGLDPADKTTAFFLRHYDGDPTAEAMKTAAIEAGVVPEIDAEAQASAAGQAQMSAAVAGGEQTPLGTTTIGDSGRQIEVPAEETEMWQEFQAALNRGEDGTDVLRRHGHDLNGTEQGAYEYAADAGVAQINPIGR